MNAINTEGLDPVSKAAVAITEAALAAQRVFVGEQDEKGLTRSRCCSRRPEHVVDLESMAAEDSPRTFG